MSLPYILGIETSCDETSIAILQGTKVLSHVTSSQIQQHQSFGGVFPELASRLHTENIGYVLTTALQEAKLNPKDIQAVLMGGHGDTMVPLPRYTTVGGIPVTELIGEEKLTH
jgi:tRNA A37 threonylcarbamoyltransferase TsaD